MDNAVELLGTTPGGATVDGNAIYGSFDRSTVVVAGTGHNVTNNVALGTSKVLTGSQFDMFLPATFAVLRGGNVVANNIAAGTTRIGFDIVGDPCDTEPPRITGNHAQGTLVGIVPRASDAAGARCTRVHSFTSAFAWDFGLLTLTGIASDLRIEDSSFVNSKHAGVLPMRRGAMTEEAAVEYSGGSVVGATHDDVCSVRAHSALCMIVLGILQPLR